MTNKTTNKTQLPEFFKLDGKIITDKTDIANQFNTFFTHIGPSLASKITTDGNKTYRHRFMQRAVFPSSGRVFAFQDGGFCRYPSTGRRRQTGRPNARPRTGCITRRTYFLRIIFKVLRLVYYCASVGADFYSFSYRTSCDLVARDQNLSPLAQPGFWR